MKKILFETHHLYYLPNFIPIIEALRSRGGYDIYVSMPQYMQERERKLCYGACYSMEIQVIKADLEATRIEEIKSANFDVIVVGNVGQLRKIVSDNPLLEEELGAKAIQGKGYLPGAGEED